MENGESKVDELKVDEKETFYLNGDMDFSLRD